MHFQSFLQSLLSLTGGLVHSTVDLPALYGPSLSAGAWISLPSDSNYTHAVTQRWTRYGAPQYLGAIVPATEEDIQNIIKISTENKIDFLVTGAGHGSSTTYQSLQNGIMIDLQQFRSAQLDPEAQRLTVGGATVFSDVIDLLYGAQRELLLPSAACVGIVGMTLGGGIGSLQGLRGMLMDSLESVRIITANGDLLEVSAVQYPDLFWALRGAGSNFGVVTSATYKVHEATNRGQAMNADFLFSATSHNSIWQILESFDEEMPAELAIEIAVAYNRTMDQPLILANVIFYGDEKDGMTWLEPWNALGPLMSRVVTVPWNALLNASFFGLAHDEGGACTKNQSVNIYSIGLNQTDVSTFGSYFEHLLAFYREYPTYDGRFLIQRYPTQGVLATPDSETAYPHRQIKTQITLEGWYTDPTIEDPVNAFMHQSRQHFQRTSGFSELAVYVNYAHGDEGPAVWYNEENVRRLTAIKEKWDPAGLFRWSNPIPWTSNDEL